ncbi:retron St85 family effector protein [Paraburkholderia adhaesiva]|uniref:retron St85 family effector protein n=1 Tax=Paraburkholderia adhaesiva TaxID=2883244 RepID=UPI001F160706|nr:retron St85 family effector protein [Paraburkholderia adhaesiva]
MSDLSTSLSSRIDLDRSRVKPYEGFIFLCGGPTDVKSVLPTSLRDALYRELVKDNSDEERIRVAEHYKDWATDSIYNDLVLFERHIAELSSIIVLVLESPGAIAELGLFSAIGEFRDKLLVFVDSQYYKSASFIKLGPVDFLEKTHGNTAEVYKWLNDKSQIDGKLAEELQAEVAEAVRARLSKKNTEKPFDRGQWLHFALLVCDLLDLYSALTVRELRTFLNEAGVEKSEHELKQVLYLLDRVGLIAMEPKGDQRFYVAITGSQYLKLHIGDGLLDVARFRSDVLAKYSTSDKKRFRAIQEVRSRR